MDQVAAALGSGRSVEPHQTLGRVGSAHRGDPHRWAEPTLRVMRRPSSCGFASVTFGIRGAKDLTRSIRPHFRCQIAEGASRGDDRVGFCSRAYL